jgi:hypothetical protein
MDGYRLSRDWKVYLADKKPKEWSEFIESVGDEVVYFETQVLRHQVESIVDWKRTKEKAGKEVDSISADVIEQLLEEFVDFINELPAGHGRGHLYRDVVGITSLLHDPSLCSYDSVEVLVGILGGMFHDIGNSVVERYAERRNYSGHAEVGAYLFGVKASHLIPPHLLRLIQFVIAAHTHYLQDFVVVKKGKAFTRVVYEDVIIDGNKIAVHLARQSDRMDMQGIPGVIRHSMTKASPTQDFSEDGFQEIHGDAMKDFRHQFTPVIRTREYRLRLRNPEERSTNVLEHLKMYADSNVGESPYSMHDSNYVKDLIMNEGALQQYIFIAQDISVTRKLSKMERDEVFRRFFALCKLFEPAKEIDALLKLFDKKFKVLQEDHQNHWANALELMTSQLYHDWYSRKERQIMSVPPFENKKLRDVVTNLHSIANTYLQEFHPQALGV